MRCKSHAETGRLSVAAFLSTATTSFHGTGISVFQHPVSPTFSVSRTFEFKGQKPKSKAISCLPEAYTNVKLAFLISKPNPPIAVVAEGL
jgi:hypothetical protein